MWSSLKETRREFWDAWNGLSEVHTPKALKAQSEKMWTARKRLLKVDPEFRAMIKDREDKANAEAEARRMQIETTYNTITSEAEAEVSAAKMRARALMRMADADLEEWVQTHRFKIRTPEEAKPKSKLVCPICYGPERFNTLNDKPTCFKCMHELVPESELKNYNREYRRSWKRRRKKY